MINEILHCSLDDVISFPDILRQCVKFQVRMNKNVFGFLRNLFVFASPLYRGLLPPDSGPYVLMVSRKKKSDQVQLLKILKNETDRQQRNVLDSD